MKRVLLVLLALLLLAGCSREKPAEPTGPLQVTFGGRQYDVDIEKLDLSGKALEGLDQLVLLPKLKELDLRDTGLTLRQYEQLTGLMPECEILWWPVFQGVPYPEDTEYLPAPTLTDEDLAVLDFFPKLSGMDVTACRDYDMIRKLMEKYPGMQVDYLLEAGGAVLKPDATDAVFTDLTDAELLTALEFLPKLQTVTLKGALPELALLARVWEENPQITFSWEVEICGRTFENTATEIDLCGIPMESVQEVEQKVVGLPLLQKVLMWDCGISNEEMESLNLRNDKVLFVWKVKLGEKVTVRTDIDNFICHNYGHFLEEGECDNFRYCTEIVALDLGHRDIKTCDFVAYMPKLKYLILADTMVRDLTPLTGLENLIFLEVFLMDLKSYEPLLSLKNLEDLNIGFTTGELDVIKQMTWLKRLWWSKCELTWEEQKELRAALPNTEIQLHLNYSSTGAGWRENQNYYDMRNLLGMPIDP